MREIARRRIAPASVRLMDNAQFTMGAALKPAQGGASSSKEEGGTEGGLRRRLGGAAGQLVRGGVEAAKKYYVTKVRGMDPGKLCAMVLLFEGGVDGDGDSGGRAVSLARDAAHRGCTKGCVS